jgi:histone-lysine N-methyltransferase SETMAR
MIDWVPAGQAVTQKYCLEVLTKLQEWERKKGPELWKISWIPHQENAPVHNALVEKQFLANKCIQSFEKPPYSPDLVPCDYYLFRKMKSALKGINFLFVNEVK